MITTVMTAIGGLVKDIQTTAVATATTIYDELSSIPESFSKGYEKGLLTSEEEVKEEAAESELKISQETEDKVTKAIRYEEVEVDRVLNLPEMIEENTIIPPQATKLNRNRNRKGR